MAIWNGGGSVIRSPKEIDRISGTVTTPLLRDVGPMVYAADAGGSRTTKIVSMFVGPLMQM